MHGWVDDVDEVVGTFSNSRVGLAVPMSSPVDQIRVRRDDLRIQPRAQLVCHRKGKGRLPTSGGATNDWIPLGRHAGVTGEPSAQGLDRCRLSCSPCPMARSRLASADKPGTLPTRAGFNNTISDLRSLYAPARVAIVGRPNVGKAPHEPAGGEKVSIVDDLPGSRDRVSTIVHLEDPEGEGPGVDIEVIDTGGFGVYVAEGQQFDDAGRT